MSVVLKMFIIQKRETKLQIKIKKIFFFILAPDKVLPCSYIFPSGMEN